MVSAHKSESQILKIHEAKPGRTLMEPQQPSCNLEQKKVLLEAIASEDLGGGGRVVVIAVTHSHRN